MSRGIRPRVYLAGPIDGHTYKGATDWRDWVTEQLAPYVIGVSPMRGETPDSPLSWKEMTEGQIRAAIIRDRWDVQTCDAMLLNTLPVRTHLTGSLVEVGWADAWQKPWVLVATEPHPLLARMALATVGTLEDAVEIIHTTFGFDR